MKCPVCGQEMVQRNFGIPVDVCEHGCQGIWFDQGELAQLDETKEGFGPALAAALHYPRNNQKKRGPINCPKCGTPMHTHQYSRAREVNVDECYRCGGFFLDSGELTEIRDHFMSDAEVAAYTDQLARGVPGYLEGLDKLAAEKQRLAAIQALTGILTRRYWWLPGIFPH